MHLLFLDESGRLDQDDRFCLGGVAVRDRDWSTLRTLWQATLAAHGWPLDRELKWHGIRTGEVPPALADAIVATIAGAPVTCYVTALDLPEARAAWPERFGNPESDYATALMFLAERFHFLLTAEDDVGIVVIDSRFREQDARLRRFFDDLTRDGTPYTRLQHIVEGLFLGPSHTSIGLQCADLVCAVTAAAERGNGQARGYLRRLEPRFARHPATGAIAGVGLKRFPDPERPDRDLQKLF